MLGAVTPSAATPATHRLYAYQRECYSGPARLVATPRDYSPGCGYAGGLPVTEVGATLGRDDLAGVDADSTARYLSDPVRRPWRLDRTRAVSGRVAAESWYRLLADVGVGEVRWDVALWGITPAGRAVQLGATSVTALARPGDERVSAPFALRLPAAAAQPFRAVRLDVEVRGLNVGMSARRLGDGTWVALPIR